MGDSEKLVMEIMKELYPKQYKKILKKKLKLDQTQKEVLLEKVTAVVQAGKKIRVKLPQDPETQTLVLANAKRVVAFGGRRGGKVSAMVSDAVISKAKALLIAGGGLIRPIHAPVTTNFLSTPELRLQAKNIGGMGFAIYKMNKKMLRAVINAHAIGDTNEVQRIVSMAKAGGRM